MKREVGAPEDRALAAGCGAADVRGARPTRRYTLQLSAMQAGIASFARPRSRAILEQGPGSDEGCQRTGRERQDGLPRTRRSVRILGFPLGLKADPGLSDPLVLSSSSGLRRGQPEVQDGATDGPKGPDGKEPEDEIVAVRRRETLEERWRFSRRRPIATTARERRGVDQRSTRT